MKNKNSDIFNFTNSPEGFGAKKILMSILLDEKTDKNLFSKIIDFFKSSKDAQDLRLYGKDENNFEQILKTDAYLEKLQIKIEMNKNELFKSEIVKEAFLKEIK